MNVMVLVPGSRFSRNVVRDLIYGCWCRGRRIGGTQFPPVSQLLLVTILRQQGHNCTLYDMGVDYGDGAVFRRIERYEAVIVLTSTSTFNEDIDILGRLKNKNPSLITIVYGSHPTFMPRQTLERPEVDIIIRHEPELPLRDLINTLKQNDSSWKSIPALGYRDKKNNIIINRGSYETRDLDELPIPERALLPKGAEYFNPIVKRRPYTTLFSMRGCPGRCIFCTVPNFYGNKVRYRSAEKVLDELELLQRQGFKEVFFRDEIFTVSKKRTLEICQGILNRDIDLTWICSGRIGSVDKQTMQIMKRAGCHMIRFGVESGVQQILDNIQKDITLDQIIQTFRWAEEVGIDTHAHFMIGSPGESRDTVYETMRFIRKIKPTIITCGVCTPYPGTRIFESVAKRHPEIGDGTGCGLKNLHTTAFFNESFTELTGEEIPPLLRKIYRDFYFRPSYIINRLRKVRSAHDIWGLLKSGSHLLGFVRTQRQVHKKE